MAVNRANFAALMEPTLREVFFEEYDARPGIMEQVYKLDSSDKKTETDQRIAGLGSWNKKTNEQADTAYEDITLADDVTYTHDEFDKGVQVTQAMQEDNQYKSVMNMTAELGRGAGIQQETSAADLFNSGFAAATSYTNYDAVSLFNDSHPNRGGVGGTQDNLGAASALADSTLKTGLTAMRKQRNENNQAINVNATQLIVPDDLEFTALEITMSTLRSSDAENAVNTLKGRLKVVIWTYLTSTTAYFLRDQKLAKNMWFWRVKPQFYSERDFDSGMVKFKGRMRYSYGYSDWRGLWGSAGA